MFLMELRDICKNYRQSGVWKRARFVQALNSVSLTIEPGKCLAVVGASGSGKSTLGRIVLGLERPDGGVALYKGAAYFKLPKKERRFARRAVQVVFQNSYGAVNPRFTGLEIVGEPLRYFSGLRGAALKDKAAKLLDEVGLSSAMLEKRPHQLSGGELQRLCLARALAPDPELIVLDEAVSALDMLTQRRVLALLRRIKQERNTAFLFISHDLRTVGNMADSLAVLRGGRVIAQSRDVNDPEQMTALRGIAAFQELIAAVLPNPIT